MGQNCSGILRIVMTCYDIQAGSGSCAAAAIEAAATSLPSGPFSALVKLCCPTSVLLATHEEKDPAEMPNGYQQGNVEGIFSWVH